MLNRSSRRTMPSVPMRPGNGRSRGFTLLEMLVVVIIAVVLTGLVVVRLGDWRSADDPHEQLQRLAALIDVQCEQALFQARPRGLRLTDSGFDFWQGTSTGWQPLGGEGIDRPRRWQGDVRAELVVDGHRADLDEQTALPQIHCQPMGELTPFDLSLTQAGTRTRLQATGSGRLTVSARQ